MEENKKPMNIMFSAINTKEIPKFIEKKISGRDYVNYGADNKFPNYLFDLYLRSSILSTIVNRCVDYTMGNKLVVNGIANAENINDDGETIEDIVKKLTVDDWIFGGFALQIIKNGNGNIKLNWLDFTRCRINEEETKLYYSDDWTKWGNKALTYDIYNPKTGKGDVIYYKGHITRGHYPIPQFIGGLTAIETQTEISKYHLNAITNNFNVNAIINFNNGQPDDTIQEETEKLLINKFNGTDAQTVMCTWNNDKEHATTVERLSDDQFDKKYAALNDSTKKEIFLAMSVTPALLGVNPENNGFSKQEFLEAFELFNRTVIQPHQKQMERIFKKLYGKDVIKFEPFSLDVETQVEEPVNVEQIKEIE
jgi:hypothetical protein